MKIIIEFYKKVRNEVFQRDEFITEFSKRLEFKNLSEAKQKFKQLEINDNQKIKIIEYHNDEADNIRKPCKVLQVND